jgi:heme exporter protein C
MYRYFAPLAIVAAAMFAYAPIAIANVRYESTMLLVQKIFYFHFPTWMVVFASVGVCGVASLVYLFRGSTKADRLAAASAELIVIFGAFGLVSGSLWARKSWNVWWDWNARLTTAAVVELVFLAYLLLRKYGGPGSEKLAAGMGIFGAATAPFLYKSVDWWRTLHPTTSVVSTLPGDMWMVALFCTGAFLVLFAMLLAARVRLEDLRANLDRLYLAAED